MSKGNKSDRNKSTPLELGAVSLNRKKRIDTSIYEDKYPGKKFCVINDMDGDVQKYIDAGFEPVKSANRTDREFKGLTDRNTGEWVKWVVGTSDAGVALDAYLLMIDKDMYQQIITGPLKARNHEIQQAMGLAARNGEAGADARDGAKVETYAPNLPTGGQGFDMETQNVPKFNSLT